MEIRITIEGSRPGIDLGTTSPQGEHANHYTNRDSVQSKKMLTRAVLHIEYFSKFAFTSTSLILILLVVEGVHCDCMYTAMTYIAIKSITSFALS